MRKIWFGALTIAVALSGVFSVAQMQNIGESDNPFSRLKILSGLQRPPRVGKIEQIELEKSGAGWARSDSRLWRTFDTGKNWQNVTPPKSAAQTLSGAAFVGENGFVVLSNVENSTFEFARTTDGGANWSKRNLDLPAQILEEAAFNRVPLEFTDSENGWLIVRLAASSNFTRAALFATRDGGANWRLEQNFMERGEYPLESLMTAALRENQTAVAKINGKDFKFLHETGGEFSFDAPLIANENVTAIDFSDSQNGWILAESGRCRAFKSDCEQSARILATNDGGALWQEVLKTKDAETRRRGDADMFSDVEFSNVEGVSTTSAIVSASPRLRVPASKIPNGATRISMNRGFDKCTAAPISQMQTWWNESPFYDVNMYISGRNRGCTQAQLNANWVSQVSAQGWGLIPTIVGYQSPCSSCTTCQKLSTDSVIAETQGRGEADISVTDANALGLEQGTILYYDMERYDDVSGTGACSTPTKAFLKGWTDRLHELGYISGTYGSPTNAMGDWINIPAASRMDAVWLARYDNVGSVWQYNAPSPVVPVEHWGKHQRIKQFQAPANATWGGITFNIDGNITNGIVAGVRAPKNKPADFDGDGKTDLSVYRPDTGAWFVLNSANGSFSAVSFGAVEDRIVPGDYDGDGKTDIGVFRPSIGVWYQISIPNSRPNAAVNRARQWGVSGDVPVPADYDGDGITDLAVFRNGGWFITTSFDPRDPNFRAEAFGQAGDLPVTGDFDGDGKADLGVFRPSTGSWFVQRSAQGFYAVQFGAAGDKPVQGDFDGDGKTDVAVYRPSNGTWYLLQSTAGFRAVFFGTPTDIPAPGDFDNDGKFDVTVFRPENGIWYVLGSQSGFFSAQFGANGDKPIPSGYLP